MTLDNVKSAKQKIVKNSIPLKFILGLPNKNYNNIIGAAGEFAVCTELSKNLKIALITPKNNPLFDIIAASPDAKKSVSIQVKTMGIDNEGSWAFNAELKKQNNDTLFIILVKLKERKRDEFYVFKYDEIVEKISNLKKLKMSRYSELVENKIKTIWLNKKDFTEDDFARLDNWDLLEI